MAKSNYGYMYVLSQRLTPQGIIMGGRHYGIGYTKKEAGQFLDQAIDHYNARERDLYYREDPQRYIDLTRRDFTIVRVSRDYMNQLYDLTYNRGSMDLPRYTPLKKVRGMWTLE